MRRKGTAQSPAANAKERDFIGTVKMLPCICCDQPGPSIADHIYGSAKKLYADEYRLERVHVGHYAILPLCEHCDSVKTRGNRRAFEDQFGKPETLWLRMLEKHGLKVPSNVVRAMSLSGSTQTLSATA